MGIEASIVVSFGDGNDSAFSVIELDNSEDGMNWNSTTSSVNSILVGGDVYFIVQVESIYAITGYSASSGTLVAQGTVYRNMESQMVFLDGTTENEFSYIPNGTDTPTIKKAYTESGSAVEPTWGSDRRTATVPSTLIPLIIDVEAYCAFSLFKLTSPNVTLAADETWPIACLIEVDLI